MHMIKITHNAGFFSCCSVKLTKIVESERLSLGTPIQKLF